jgi:acetyl-CoA acetyltransferase
MRHEHGRRIRGSRDSWTNASTALVGGVESMSRVQIGLGQNQSDWLRRIFQARGALKTRMSNVLGVLDTLSGLGATSRVVTIG